MGPVEYTNFGWNMLGRRAARTQGTLPLRLSSWLKLLTPRPQLLSSLYVFTLIFLPLCRSRPLSVSPFPMTLCPPSTVLFGLFSSHTRFSPINLPSSVRLPISCHPPHSVSPSWSGTAGRPPDPFRVRTTTSLDPSVPPSVRPSLSPFLPQVSVCRPQAALVSRGLWGRRSSIGFPLQQSGSPAGCLFNNPKAAWSALRQARTPRSGQAQ